MTEKDYSLLRPFDLEAAKAGALLTSYATSQFDGDPGWKYVAGPDSVGLMIVEIIENGEFTDASETGCFLMAPLCWVEGKPAYPGDVLEHAKLGEVVAKSRHASREMLVAEKFDSLALGNLAWPRPKPVKYWINIYECSCFASKAAADRDAGRTRLDCIEIELPPLKP